MPRLVTDGNEGFWLGLPTRGQGIDGEDERQPGTEGSGGWVLEGWGRVVIIGW